ncbi:MAG: hypothetical protein IJ740_01130 [Ruminococcus sp.]|nr:hypothetical protein [Ruminococcus sp.]
MLRYLKKDSQQPREYNRGVSFLRAGIVSLILIALVSVAYLLYSPEKLTFKEMREYTVTYRSSHPDYDRLKIIHSTIYELKLKDETTGKESNTTVTQDMFENARQGDKLTLPVYDTPNGKIFKSVLGNTDVDKATAEYYKKFPTLMMKFFKWALIILAFLTVAFIGEGIEQILKSGRHVFLPKEIPENGNAVKQPDHDDIFK